MQSGYTIIFSGPDFAAAGFLASSKLATLKPGVVTKGEPLVTGEVADYSALVFHDIHEGPYPFQAQAEILDRLAVFHAEFLRLTALPEIQIRQVHLFGDAAACTVQLTGDDIALLQSLKLSLSITPEA